MSSDGISGVATSVPSANGIRANSAWVPMFAATNWPGLIVLTPLPISSTMPQYSCPIGIGFVIASVGFRIAGSGRCSTRTSRGRGEWRLSRRAPGGSARLDLEAVVPIRASAPEQLRDTRGGVSHEKEHAPALVLPDMDAFVWPEMTELLARDGKDHMPEDDGAERQASRERTATRDALAKADFQSAARPSGVAAACQGNRRQHEPQCGAGGCPEQLPATERRFSHRYALDGQDMARM